MASFSQILIVDDVPDNVKVLGETLADKCNVSFALSGAEALTQIERRLPDLILLDVMMPGMDGYEVMSVLQCDPRTKKIPVIFVTASVDVASETRALAAGAVDFIPKPINKDVVRARVQLQLDLMAREREFRELNEDLERKVQQRTLTLRDALTRVEAAQKAKAAFLVNMTHEIRTPLNVILGMAYLIGRPGTDPKVHERAAKIGLAGQNLLNLLNGVLDAAKLEADDFHIETIGFSLDGLLDVCEMQARVHAKGRERLVVRDLDPAVPLALLGDPQRLGQVLGNFLSNAVKFSKQGPITLRTKLLATHGTALTVRFEVQDQGVGIAADLQSVIFDSFVQGDDSRTRSYGGVGLGLAICKHLVERMGGHLGVQSSPGEGSTFWAELPLQRGAATTRLTSSDPADARVRQIASHLSAMLAEDDYSAYALGKTQRRSCKACWAPIGSCFRKPWRLLSSKPRWRIYRRLLRQVGSDVTSGCRQAEGSFDINTHLPHLPRHRPRFATAK